MVAPAGSVVFTHCGVLHAGSLNQLPSTRFFISCYINRVGLPVRDVQQGPVRATKRPVSTALVVISTVSRYRFSCTSGDQSLI
eukprot:COSAG02_NODE_11285_length_1754_cov_1.717825_2_plen_83_part_00